MKVLITNLTAFCKYLQVGLIVQNVIIGQILFREVHPYDMFNNHVVSENEKIALGVAALPKNILLAS